MHYETIARKSYISDMLFSVQNYVLRHSRQRYPLLSSLKSTGKCNFALEGTVNNVSDENL